MAHISFSELKIWKQCTHRHKKEYTEKIRSFHGNIHTAFGKAMHSVCEDKLYNTLPEQIDYLKERLKEEVRVLTEDKKVVIENDVGEFESQGIDMIPEILPALEDYFDEYEILETEARLMEPLDLEGIDPDFKFKGFIDLIVHSGGKVHIIDWKTCGWGWDARKRSDPMNTYQLTFYKHYYAQKYDLDPSDVETHFALLKRTAKKGKKVEFFRVTSGKRKTTNALDLLRKAVINILRGKSIKDRRSCKYCPLHKTEHCR